MGMEASLGVSGKGCLKGCAQHVWEPQGGWFGWVEQLGCCGQTWPLSPAGPSPGMGVGLGLQVTSARVASGNALPGWLRASGSVLLA